MKRKDIELLSELSKYLKNMVEVQQISKLEKKAILRFFLELKEYYYKKKSFGKSKKLS